MNVAAPFSRSLYVMLKPAGASCNMRCAYCYYLEKACLYKDGAAAVMGDDMLELFVQRYMEAQTGGQVLFTWHGGEPLLRPISFYEKAMRLQRRYARGRQVDNVIQTNGTLLTDEWCRFLKDNGWLVGVSIDGPQEFHDAFRLTRSGKPTWEKVMRGIGLLRKHGVEWNAMAVVNSLNVAHPLRFYRFFKDIGCQYLQFSPIVERLSAHADGRCLASPDDPDSCPVADWSVNAAQWGRFLNAMFDEWVRHDVGTTFVELFDCTLANWCGVTPGICVYARECGNAAVMEPNGDVYSCDHFVFPEYRLGNLRKETIYELLNGRRQQDFSCRKHALLPRQCRECEVEFACHGECPKNRFLTDCYGGKGLNYLCEGYRMFYHHAAPYMDFMRNELAMGRPPANVMKFHPTT